MRDKKEVTCKEKSKNIMFLFMAAFFTTTSIFAESKSPKVVVIGAGIAGLTTAHRLHAQGIDVDIYEARNRVGGRILSVHVNGNVAELGAQNITDGGRAENIHRLIEEFGLEVIGNTVNVDHSYFDGEKLVPMEQLFSNQPFGLQDLKSRMKSLVLKSRNMKEVVSGILDEEDPLYKIIAVRLAGYEGATLEKLSPLYAETLLHMLLGGISAAHPGNHVHLSSIRGGNGLLPEKIAEELGNRVHLNMPLVQVSKDENHRFMLTFWDGQEVKADILVLAIPCSVYSEIAFEEKSIPSERLEAIKSIHYGTNAKILVPLT